MRVPAGRLRDRDDAINYFGKFSLRHVACARILPNRDNIRGRMFNYIIEVNSMLYKDNNNNMEVLRRNNLREKKIIILL